MLDKIYFFNMTEPRHILLYTYEIDLMLSFQKNQSALQLREICRKVLVQDRGNKEGVKND